MTDTGIITANHNVSLVILSVLIAVIASYTALDLSGRVTVAQGHARRLWLAGGAIAMGIGIWSMHFVAMLAYNLPIPMGYDFKIVLASMAVAVLASVVALFVVSRQQMGILALLAGSAVMGLGIAAMHYTGMAAMQLEAITHYEPKLVALSVAIAIGASLIALRLGFHLRTETTVRGSVRKIGSAIVMGVAIAGMHYTAMAAVRFQQTNQLVEHLSHEMDNSLLGVGIGIATLVILALALLASLLDRRITIETARAEALRQSEERFRSLVQNSSDIIAVVSANGTVGYKSPSIKRMLGYQPENWKKAFEFVHPDDLAKAESLLTKARSCPSVNITDEFRLLNADGQVRDFEVIVNNLLTEPSVAGIVTTYHDTTERKQAEQALQKAYDELEIKVEQRTVELKNANKRLQAEITERQRAEEALQKAYDELEIRVAERTTELRAANERLQTEIIERQRAEEEVRLLQTMTQAISEAQDFHSALAVTLHQVCEATDWDFGEAWIPQPDNTALVCSSARYSSDKRLEEYRKLSEGLTFSPGIGLPGRVWSSQQPEWVKEVSLKSDNVSFRGEIATECGLRCGLGIPIIANDQVLAVLVFFMSETCVEDKRLVELVSAVATQLGWVIQRKQAEEEIKLLNQDLQHQTVELEAANKELEAFSYSVSHDLRAPLRAMNGFSRILLNDYAPQLPPEARRYLQMLRDNAQQMGHLIDDLLRFSRLSRSPLKKQLVAPTAIVCQALTDLRHEQENRQVEISISDLPVCQADPSLLKQVWVNLLANALKFTCHRAIAQIEVGYQETNDELVYFIKDNGVGFDMQYAHKLFGVFQRLHRAEDYDGTGVGLAIVWRIIHRHGGRVWAEAEVNKGANFYFTLGGNIPNDRDDDRNFVSGRQSQRRGIDTPLLKKQ